MAIAPLFRATEALSARAHETGLNRASSFRSCLSVSLVHAAFSMGGERWSHHLGSELGSRQSVDQNDMGRRCHRSGRVLDASVFSAARADVTAR